MNKWFTDRLPFLLSSRFNAAVLSIAVDVELLLSGIFTAYSSLLGQESELDVTAVTTWFIKKLSVALMWMFVCQMC